MLQVQFNPFPVISTARLVLRKMHDDDADAFYYLRSHPELMRFIPRPRAQNKQDALDLIHKNNTLVQQNEAINWAVTLKGEDQLIGAIGLFNIKPEHYRAELGYLLHDKWHGRGIMPEAVNAVTDYGFRVMGLHSIEAIIAPANVASERTLQKCGFIKEGHLKECEQYEGVWLDKVIYSLLANVK